MSEASESSERPAAGELGPTTPAQSRGGPSKRQSSHSASATPLAGHPRCWRLCGARGCATSFGVCEAVAKDVEERHASGAVSKRVVVTHSTKCARRHFMHVVVTHGAKFAGSCFSNRVWNRSSTQPIPPSAARHFHARAEAMVAPSLARNGKARDNSVVLRRTWPRTKLLRTATHGLARAHAPLEGPPPA